MHKIYDNNMNCTMVESLTEVRKITGIDAAQTKKLFASRKVRTEKFAIYKY